MKRYILYIFSLLTIGIPLKAETPILNHIAEALSLSLDSCKQLAIENSIDIKIAENTITKAKAEKGALLSMYFPKISATGGVTYVFKNPQLIESIDGFLPPFEISDERIPEILLGPINSGLDQLRNEIIDAWTPIDISLRGVYMAGITLIQPVFAGGRIATGNNMARIGIEMAEENLKLKHNETILDAEKSYWLYVSVKEKVKLAESYDKLLTEIENLVTNVADVEMINHSDLMQVKVQHNRVRQQLQMARNGAELSRMALCRIIGADYKTQIFTTDSTLNSPLLYNLTPDSAVMNRSEYRLMQNMIKMKESEVRLIIGEYLPAVGISSTWGIMGGFEINNMRQQDINISNVVATANIPITHWWEGSRKIKSAKIDKKIAELEMQKNVDLMRLEIEQATYNMVESYDEIKRATVAKEAAQENYRIINDRYSIGLTQIVELLDAQASMEMAENNLIDAKINYQIAHTTWMKATGQL